MDASITVLVEHSYDIFLWPDGIRCYRHECIKNCPHLDTSYEVLPYGSDRWHQYEAAA